MSSTQVLEYAEAERAQLKRNAELAHTVGLWKKTMDLLSAENKSKERKLRKLVRTKLAGTDASSLLTVGPKSDIHKLLGQKKTLGKLETERVRKEEACHYIQLILERLQQQILAEKSELKEHVSDELLARILESSELEATLAQAQSLDDSQDDLN